MSQQSIDKLAQSKAKPLIRFTISNCNLRSSKTVIAADLTNNVHVVEFAVIFLHHLNRLLEQKAQASLFARLHKFHNSSLLVIYSTTTNHDNARTRKTENFYDHGVSRNLRTDCRLFRMNSEMIEEQSDTELQPSPESEVKFGQLKQLLQQMFQLDRGDLDFGLYRILNLKAREISDFLECELLSSVQEVLYEATTFERTHLEEELNKTIETLHSFKVDPNSSEVVADLRNKLDEAIIDAEAEGDVYNHLINFFSLYYAEGDFISQRRYKSGSNPAYLIPYNGEEVKLFWANTDQYYIKTTENYSTYTFSVGSKEQYRLVRFEITVANNENDNVKEADGKQRRFFLAKGKKAISVNTNELVVQFEHRPLTEQEKKSKLFSGNGSIQQNKINEVTIQNIISLLNIEWLSYLTAPTPTKSNQERTILEKHVSQFTAKNSFDYFIHKDLSSFLIHELDIYIKTNVLNLNDLVLGDTNRLRRAVKRTHAVSHVGNKIITFLSQLEDYQKRLWLKKKFIFETQWCVTLDRIPLSFYADIATNESQREEWIELYSIDDIEGDFGNGGYGYSEPLTVDFLKANPYLVLDTKHFDHVFVNRLLAELSKASPLDEQLDGLLIHGENFQALRVLRKKYANQVKCVYADPPYNTGNDGFLYKDHFRRSSWLSMIADRLLSSTPLMRNDACFFISIDDNEIGSLTNLIQTIFPDCQHVTNIAARLNPRGRTLDKYLAKNHEYIVAFSLFDDSRSIHEIVKNGKALEAYKYNDSKGRYRKLELRNRNPKFNRANRPNLFFPIYTTPNGGLVSLEQSSEYPIEIYPRNTKGEDGCWTWSRDKITRQIDDISASLVKTGVWRVFRKDRIKEGSLPTTKEKSIWLDKDINNENGTELLRNLFGSALYPFPKSSKLIEKILNIGTNDGDIIIDYFSGSGTTGHAVIDVNRENDAKRKYILIEMADYFDTILLPRIKKAVFSKEWKEGKPVDRNGLSHFFKYFHIESYEDTLDNLEFKTSSSELLSDNRELNIDYLIRYSLEEETSGSPCLLGDHFKNPFDFNLSIFREGVRHNVRVDLPETFNYLIGLNVSLRNYVDKVLFFTGTDTNDQECLVMWRDLDEIDDHQMKKWFENYRKLSYPTPDKLYVNGDSCLNAIRQQNESWVALTIESEFRKLMFEDEYNDYKR